MPPTVWHSRIMSDHEIGKKLGFAVKWFGRDWNPPTHVAPPRSLDDIQDLFAYARGEPLRREAFPEALSVFEPKRFQKTGDLFPAGGYFIVRKKLAQVLSRFNLGEGELLQIPIYQADRTSRLDEDFFIWKLGATKKAVQPDQCVNIESIGGTGPNGESRWQATSDVKDDDIVLSASAACAAPDVWCDPQLMWSMFFSDALVAAFRESKINANFHLNRCRLI